MPHDTLQFPLPLLAYEKTPHARLDAAITYAAICTGRNRFKVLSPTQAAQELIGSPPLTASNGVSADEIKAILLGCKYCGVVAPKTKSQANYWMQCFQRVENFLQSWKASGHTIPWTRVPGRMVFEARDGNAWTYRRFTALCAVNAVIGSKPVAIVTRNRVRAGMLGYSSGSVLFDDAGQLTTSGRALLESREDQAFPPELVPTTSQARTLIDNLVKTGLLHRFTPPKRGSLTWYSKTLPNELIGMELIRRAKRTASNPRLKELGEMLERAKNGEAPLCGETQESSQHNSESPRNRGIATQWPPDSHSVATPSPLNAAVNAAGLNAPKNASAYAGTVSTPTSHEKTGREDPQVDYWAPDKVEERRQGFQKIRESLK